MGSCDAPTTAPSYLAIIEQVAKGAKTLGEAISQDSYTESGHGDCSRTFSLHMAWQIWQFLDERKSREQAGKHLEAQVRRLELLPGEGSEDALRRSGYMPLTALLGALGIGADAPHRPAKPEKPAEGENDAPAPER